jgi:hypothetical protein
MNVPLSLWEELTAASVQYHYFAEIFPSGYPNQIPSNNNEFAARRRPDENGVDGYTFHAYSIAPMIAILCTD